MITNYNEFLVEKAIMMINESEVVYSSKFRKLLTEIESPIAKALSEIENQDLKVTNNYFDISDNKDTVSFISDKKAIEITGGEKEKRAKYNGGGGFLTHNMETNGKIFSLLGFVPPKDEDPFRPDEREVGDIVKKVVSPITGKVYVWIKFPEGECVVNETSLEYEDNFKQVWNKNRQTIRTGRAIRALLGSAKKTFNDSEIEDFVNKYKSAYDRMNDIFRYFKLVKGDDIGYWYDFSKYAENRGTLSNSCMARVPKSYFEIYMTNKCCSLLILNSEKDETKIKGRALVWELKTPKDGTNVITFMDRIYTNQDSDIELFREYAKKMKWYYKGWNDSSNDSPIVSPDGVEIEKVLTVEIKKGRYGKYPYVDTLKYFDPDEGILSTDEDFSSKILEDTCGGIYGECDRCDNSGRITCDECSGDGNIDCYECDGTGRNQCYDCSGEGKLDCGNCDGHGKVDDETCDDCGGKGKVDCSECKGNGDVDCDNCDGSGRRECPECYGNGTMDCPDCQ